jgi:hypothetical protein
MNTIHFKTAIVAASVLLASGASAQALPTFQQIAATYVDQLQIITGLAYYPGSSGVSSCTDSRSQRAVITFTPAFDSASPSPNFTAAISMFDVDHTSNARIRVNVVSVTPSQATVDVVTWCDTNLYGVQVSYMALGQRQL